MADCDRRTMRSCYDVLEIKPNASLEEVKEAYRDLAFVWHPDRYVNNPRLQKKAQDRFQAINHAYHVLECCLAHSQDHGHQGCNDRGGYPRSPVAQAYHAASNAHANHSHTNQNHSSQNHSSQSHSSQNHSSHHSHQSPQSYQSQQAHQSHQAHQSNNHVTQQHHHQSDHHPEHHPDPNHQGYAYGHHAADRERERRINMKPPPQVEINPWLLLCVICLTGVLTNITLVVAQGAPGLELMLLQPTMQQR